MALSKHVDVLRALLRATRPSEVRKILSDLGDREELSVFEPFSQLGYVWRFYGENDSNLSTINLGSKPGRSLTERVTNGIDAVIERRMLEHAGDPPASPMAAVGKFFGRPPSTAENGVYKWKDSDALGHDRLVRVVMSSGDIPTERTVDVVDAGIGIRPQDFSKTILSLQKGNKIKKPYLIGAFGQGGSASVGFSKYTLVASRHVEQPNVVAFTVVKQKYLPEPYRWPAYTYLALDGEGETVPHFELEGVLDLWDFAGANKPDGLHHGTIVRHYGYSLSGLEKTLSPSPGNLYHLFQYMLFDPLLPFRVIDLSADRPSKDERITGSRNRLMSYTVGGTKVDELFEDDVEGDKAAEGTGTTLRHHKAREMVRPPNEETPSIGVEYWVPLNRRKVKDRIALRSSSSDLFVDRNYPIIGTMNGQNQGELAAKILRDMGLPLLSRHMVLHIDVTHASSNARQSLFSSTREGFRDGDVLIELVRVIRNMLEDDEKELLAIERELTNEIVAKEMSGASADVKKEIVSLLRDAGFKTGDKGDVLVPAPDGNQEIEAPPKKGPKPKVPQSPLPTLPYPQVTFLKIVYPEDELRVAMQDNHSVRIETDANFRFDREGRLAIRAEPGALEVASKGELVGGRMLWRLRPAASATAGQKGDVVVTLTKPDGSQLSERVPFEVLPPRVEKAKTEKGEVPKFDVVPVDPEENPETFDRLWSDRGELQKNQVAYKAEKTADGIFVYYSTAFEPFADQKKKLGTKPEYSTRFEHNYKVWIGYHAIIQLQQRASTSSVLDGDDSKLDTVQEMERAMVAEMQVKQAMRVTELQMSAAKAAVAAE